MRLPDRLRAGAAAATGRDGLKPKSVRKKMKTAAFAAAVNRDDIVNGAEDLGVDLNEHIEFCIAAMSEIAAELDLLPKPVV